MPRRHWSFAACLFLCFFTLAQNPEEQALQSELNATVERLNSEQAWLDDAAIRLRDLTQAVDELDVSIHLIAQRKSEVAGKIDNLERSVANLRNESADSERELNQLLVEKSWILQALKKIDSAILLMLDNPDDPTLLDRLHYYHRLLLEERDASHEQIRRRIELINTNISLLDTNSRSLQNNRQSIIDQENELTASRQRRREVVDELRAAIVESELESAKLRSDQARLESLLNHIGINSATIPSGEGPSSLSWPVNGTVRHRFGESRGDGRVQWEGVYFSAPPGTEVSAVQGGLVKFAQWLRGFGMTLIIEHDENLISLYGNCDSLLKQRGDFVEAGEIIAVVGTSGGQREVGLYFELRQQNTPIDPLEWFDRE